MPITPVRMVSPGHRRLLFSAWALCAIVPVAALMAKHVAPFARTGQAGFAAHAQWRVRHVLVAGCECSSVVARALASRTPLPDVDERAVLAGPDTAIETTLRNSGWMVDVMPAERVHHEYGVPGGPWLLVADPAGAERYSGGYAASRPVHVWDVDDRRLIAAAIRGDAAASHPAFGCAASTLTGID